MSYVLVTVDASGGYNTENKKPCIRVLCSFGGYSTLTRKQINHENFK